MIVAIVAVAVALLNLGITINKVGDVMELTGFVTDTGSTNLTIESTASVNFTTEIIDWGSGTVDTEGGYTEAYLDTKTGSVTQGNWTVNSAGLVLENIGNVNVTLDVKAGKDASTFIGGTNESYKWLFEDNEAGSCFGNFIDILQEDEWNDTGKTLPGNLGYSQTATIGNYVYLFGGHNSSGSTNVIYRAPTSDPTNWTDTGETLPGNLGSSQTATIGNYVYLFGGSDGMAYTGVIYRAPIESSGSSLGWEVFVDVNTTSPGTRVCSQFGYLNSADTINIHFNVTVPYDALPGAKGDIITVTATAA